MTKQLELDALIGGNDTMYRQTGTMEKQTGRQMDKQTKGQKERQKKRAATNFTTISIPGIDSPPPPHYYLFAW